MKIVLLSVLLIAVGSKVLAHEKPDGGMSGGGGNVIDPRPPEGPQDPEQIEKMIFDSRHVLRGYLQQKEIQFREGRLPESEVKNFTLLFRGKVHVQEVISRVELDVKDEEPCFDQQGNPVDGSIRPLHKGKICVSSYNLAAKVHVREIRPQATALLLHEYSEALGVSEEGAVEIQKGVLMELGNEELSTTTHQWREQ